MQEQTDLWNAEKKNDKLSVLHYVLTFFMQSTHCVNQFFWIAYVLWLRDTVKTVVHLQLLKGTLGKTSWQKAY